MQTSHSQMPSITRLCYFGCALDTNVHLRSVPTKTVNLALFLTVVHTVGCHLCIHHLCSELVYTVKAEGTITPGHRTLSGQNKSMSGHILCCPDIGYWNGHTQMA